MGRKQEAKESKQSRERDTPRNKMEKGKPSLLCTFHNMGGVMGELLLLFFRRGETIFFAFREKRNGSAETVHNKRKAYPF
jgi:hypothetical protein